MPDYFFSGKTYIRVIRGETGPGTPDETNAPISNWGWPASFTLVGGKQGNGIDAALWSGTDCYFFSGPQYIRVVRGSEGPGKVDEGPLKIADVWGWGSFGANGIDAALNSGSVDYFFSGQEYIRVVRGDTGPGKIDEGPTPISNWHWPSNFALVGGKNGNGIDAALYSGGYCYFFSGPYYIRVVRGDIGSGTVDEGPQKISDVWGWGSFGANGIDAALFSGIDTAPPSESEPESEQEESTEGPENEVDAQYGGEPEADPDHEGEPETDPEQEAGIIEGDGDDGGDDDGGEGKRHPPKRPLSERPAQSALTDPASPPLRSSADTLISQREGLSNLK